MRSTGMWIVGVVLVVLLSGCLAAAGPGPIGTPDLPFYVTIYGDSFTKAWEPSRGDRPELSWATATDSRVASIRQQVHAVRPAGEVTNAAVSGARMRDLPSQVTSASPDADVVIVWLGLNDLCLNAPSDDLAYRETVRVAFDEVRAIHPRAKVLVFSIPDMWRLHEEHLKNVAAVAFWSQVEGYCSDFFRPPPHPLAATLAQTRLQTLNGVLRSEAVSHGFTYSEALAWPALTLKHFSVDYFHPNVAGEGAIAAAAWPAVARLL